MLEYCETERGQLDAGTYRVVESEPRALPKATTPTNNVNEAPTARRMLGQKRLPGILRARMALKKATEIWKAGTPNVRIVPNLQSSRNFLPHAYMIVPVPRMNLCEAIWIALEREPLESTSAAVVESPKSGLSPVEGRAKLVRLLQLQNSEAP